MHNNLDKQPVKQNTPIVAIGGCGQVLTINTIIAQISIHVKYKAVYVSPKLKPEPPLL